MNIIQCKGEGAGSCKSCDDHGIWNSHWMCFLYQIEGYGEDCYCSDCIAAIQEEIKNSNISNLNI